MVTYSLKKLQNPIQMFSSTAKPSEIFPLLVYCDFPGTDGGRFFIETRPNNDQHARLRGLRVYIYERFCMNEHFCMNELYFMKYFVLLHQIDLPVKGCDVWRKNKCFFMSEPFL